MKMRVFLWCSVLSWLLEVSVTCQSEEAPTSPSENQYVHPNASISSPSGAGHKDLLRDWVCAQAQQGGVKPAGMFHIHTQREYIISPSGHCALSGGRDSDFALLGWFLCDFFTTWRKNIVIVKCGPILLTDAGFSQSRWSGLAGLQGRWWPMAERSVPSGHHPWSCSDLPTQQAAGLKSAEDGAPHSTFIGLLSLLWSNTPRTKMSRG